MILVSVAMRFCEMVGKRTHELELRQELRRERTAIPECPVHVDLTSQQATISEQFIGRSDLIFVGQVLVVSEP